MSRHARSKMSEAVKVFRSWEGRTEHPPGSNHVFAWDMTKPSWNGSAWCAAANVAAYLSVGIDLRKLMDNPYYCPNWVSLAKNNGWFNQSSGLGDLVMYGNNGYSVHTGMSWPGRGSTYRAVEGNGLPLETPVLTVDGWRPIGSLDIGDEMVDPKGEKSIVRGVYPQGERPCYRITFSDGREILADEEHRWTVRNARHPDSPWRVLTTAELITTMDGGRKWRIPYVETAPELSGATDADLPLPAWMVGAFIGDGCLTRGPALAASSEHMIEKSYALVGAAERVDLKDNSKHGHANGYTHHFPQCANALGELDLIGHTWDEKLIPDQYLTAGVQARTDLLAGLLDSDGTCDVQGRASYSTGNLKLALQVQDLVRSLGGTTGLKVRHPTYRMLGSDEKRQGSVSYEVSNIRLPFNPFTRPHKAERFTTMAERRTVRGWSITSIEPVSPMETVCISVSAPSETYIAEGWLVTHNTSGGSAGSQDDGDGVYVRWRGRGWIVGWVDMEKVIDYMIRKGLYDPDNPVKVSTPSSSSSGGSSFYDPTGDYSVKKIQRIVGVTADGLYGTGTRRAVRKYQRRLGVPADGLWGPTTEAAHERSQNRDSPNAPKFPLPSGWYFGPKSGPEYSVSGYYGHRDDFRRWQRRMRKRGWTISVDGLYGDQSASVARAFQREKGLSVDGLIGNDTWTAAWEEPIT